MQLVHVFEHCCARLSLQTGHQNTWKNVLPLIVNHEIEELLAHPAFANWKESVEKKTALVQQVQADAAQQWEEKFSLHKSAKELALSMPKGFAYRPLFFRLFRLSTTKVPPGFWAEESQQRWFIGYMEEHHGTVDQDDSKE